MQQCCSRKIAKIVMAALMVCFAQGLVAHPFDLPAPEVDLEIDLGKRSVRVEYLFRCDTLVTSLQEQQNSKDGLDRDGNGTISAQEFADRKSEYLSEFARVSNLRVDGKAIELHGSLAASSIFDIRGEGDITGARAVG
ncbi:MAG: hypothetical protein KDA51_17035, partial [Planctomycetales bacterium]|nr:hypothetical protein [Planctomycetales bacterium]